MRPPSQGAPTELLNRGADPVHAMAIVFDGKRARARSASGPQ